MGQKESRVAIKEGWHQKFGKIDVLGATSSHSLLIRATFPHQKETDHRRWWQMVQRLTQSPPAEFLILPKRMEEEPCGACSQEQGRSGLKLYYAWFQVSLHQEVRNRREIGQLFPEYQLWYLMLVLLRVAAYFEIQGSYVGNLHPSNVFLDNQGRASLFTVFSAPNEPQNMERILSCKFEDAFLAPEELPLKEGGEGVEQSRVDLFNIGLILLSAALLRDCYYLYLRNNFQLSEERLQQYKDELEGVGALKYRKTLRTFILRFLTADPQARGLPSYYLSLLRRHEQQIMHLEDFHPDIHFTVESSPQVLSYIDKASPNASNKRFLSLTKHSQSIQKEGKGSGDTHEPSIEQATLYRPGKVDRKLFQE